jgi:hypothetical protein
MRVELRQSQLEKIKVKILSLRKRSKMKIRRKRSSHMLNRPLSTSHSRQTQMHTSSQLTVTVFKPLTQALVENYSETYWMDYDIRMR